MNAVAQTTPRVTTERAATPQADFSAHTPMMAQYPR
jgi:hypothetical protein